VTSRLVVLKTLVNQVNHRREGDWHSAKESMQRTDRKKGGAEGTSEEKAGRETREPRVDPLRPNLV